MPRTRVLIVDDSEADQFIARMVIADALPTVDIVQARDGQHALDVLAQQGVDAFDIILLDINMPRMDGHTFLKHYSANDRRPPVVVMLTSSDQHDDRERTSGYDCVDGYRVKPLTADWVLKTLG